MWDRDRERGNDMKINLHKFQYFSYYVRGFKIRRQTWEKNILFKVIWREHILFCSGAPNKIDYM